MSYTEILYQVENGIATITLNNPEVMNATSPTMHHEWANAIREARDDENVKVVIVTGAGRAFCAGRNLKTSSHAEQGKVEEPTVTRTVGEHDVAEILQSLNKPYIGAINGAAAGGGMDMASQCDIRFASESARFNMAYIRMGAMPSQGGLWTLPRIVGTAKALELIWTGKTIDAQEALSIGYVSKIFPEENFLTTVQQWCEPLINGPQETIQEDKKLAYRLLGINDLVTAIGITDDSARWVRQKRNSEEGRRAWLERRNPNFS